MVYRERNTWATLMAICVALVAYAAVILPQLAAAPVSRIDWVVPMLWTIGGAIVGAVVFSILWGIVAGVRDREGVGQTDDRDRDIARMGERVGQAFLVLGGLGALALCAVRADWFWIAHALFAGFAASALIGAVAQVIAYRRGLV